MKTFNIQQRDLSSSIPWLEVEMKEMEFTGKREAVIFCELLATFHNCQIRLSDSVYSSHFHPQVMLSESYR